MLNQKTPTSHYKGNRKKIIILITISGHNSPPLQIDTLEK